MSGRSSRSTLMLTNRSFISAAVSVSSNDSCAMTWHQWTGGVADRQQDRFLSARASSRAAGPTDAMHRIVRVLQQVGRGLVTEQVRGLGHNVALLGCRDDIGRHGRRHHLCRRLGCRAGSYCGDAAERSGQPYHMAALCGRVPAPRRASFRRLRDGEGTELDQGMVVWLPGPGSYAGEDSAESTCTAAARCWRASPVRWLLSVPDRRNPASSPAAPSSTAAWTSPRPRQCTT